ncbi:MAG: ATP-binding cassette domain-containing protein [Lachnospiraceae bacterium]|nr:ATP-binding cassette domain-containing protein [Lachnospiraceae bacterium]
MENIIRCDSLVKIYKTDDLEVMALQGLDLEIAKGELMAIVGKSGSGKSTLLKILGGLERPSAGKVIYNDTALNEFSEQELFGYRNNNIGFVWQKSSDNLLKYITASENVAMPLIFKGIKEKERRDRAHLLLDMVGLSDKYDSYPNQLSGGEQQRVAIAVALSGEPDILLMDEPTGAVDRKTSEELQDLFCRLNKEKGITIIIVTHDVSLAEKVDRTVMISDGKISSERLLDGEYSVLDKAGRVRLSKELREAVGINSNRVKLEIEGGKLTVVPSEV